MPRTPQVPLAERTVLAQRIVAARNARAWRQRDLARAGDFDQRQVASWEADITVPTLANVIRVADALEVTLDWLVGRAPSHLPCDTAEANAEQASGDSTGLAPGLLGISRAAACG